jgi:hypothetical protein
MISLSVNSRLALIVVAPFVVRVIAFIGYALWFIFEIKFVKPLFATFAALLYAFLFAYFMRLMIHRRWMSATLLAFAMMGSLFWRYPEHRVAFWKYEINENTYLKAIASDTQPFPKFKWFLLAEDLAFAGGGTWYYLIYDESEETALPEQERSLNWKGWGRGFTNKEQPLSRVNAAKLDKNFFLVTASH